MNKYLERIEQMKTENPFKKTQDIVYLVLKEAIETNEFLPGQRVYENDLSELLGVSRTPIRDAFKRLEEEGYVETRKRKGTYISRLRMNKLSEIFYARMGIELVATKLALLHINPEQFARLEAVHEKIQNMSIEDGKEQIMEYDYEFHKIVFEAAGNQYLKEMNEMLRHDLIREESYRTMLSSFSSLGLESFRVSHGGLFKAFKEKDLVLVEEVVLAHSRATFNFYGMDCEI